MRAGLGQARAGLWEEGRWTGEGTEEETRALGRVRAGEAGLRAEGGNGGCLLKGGEGAHPMGKGTFGYLGAVTQSPFRDAYWRRRKEIGYEE